MSVAWNQPFYSYNGNTSFGNATANNNIIYSTNSGFNYYNDVPELVQDTSFGSYELVSEDPLIVKYTIADGVKWSDGTAVDAADLLLNWAALSGALQHARLRLGRVHRPRHRRVHRRLPDRRRLLRLRRRPDHGRWPRQHPAGDQ